MFKFIHAADMHLDSPLRGLERYEGAPVESMRQATRQAFANVVQLATQEAVQFVLLAGDLYDGDWKDYNTGLYLVAQMARLRDAGIPVLLISGNHDAANRMTRSLSLPDNVRMLSSKNAETVVLENCGVAIHGQGFATAAVTEDLSVSYPPAVTGHFNIGMLHTGLDGREGHARYAPCTVEGLLRKRYDYWALGHVHKRETIHQEPLIVFPGNIQGRHARETGPKGCTLVSVDNRFRVQAEPRFLDVLRWELCEVDASQAEDGYEILDRFSHSLADLLRQRDHKPLALRVEVVGSCPAHEKLAAAPLHWTGEIRARALAEGSGEVWVEKVKLHTRLPREANLGSLLDGPVGELVQLLEELKANEDRLLKLGGELVDLKRKLPLELKEGQDALDLDSPEGLRRLLDQVRHLLVGRLVAGGTGR